MSNDKIKLLFFGITHDISGQNEMDWSLKESSVGELRASLEDRFPKLKELKSFAIAVNEEYASESTALKAEDHVALIPPVSGG